MRLVKTSPNARRDDEAIAEPIDRSRNNAVGFVLDKPQRGCGSVLVNFAFFASQIHLCIFGAKKAKFPQKS
jgi:hypothetical protein